MTLRTIPFRVVAGVQARCAVVKVVTVGYTEGVKYEITCDYVVKERDKHNNWTKRYMKRVEVQTIDDEDDPGTSDTSIDHQYQVRTLKYAK